MDEFGLTGFMQGFAAITSVISQNQRMDSARQIAKDLLLWKIEHNDGACSDDQIRECVRQAVLIVDEVSRSVTTTAQADAPVPPSDGYTTGLSDKEIEDLIRKP